MNNETKYKKYSNKITILLIITLIISLLGVSSCSKESKKITQKTLKEVAKQVKKQKDNQEKRKKKNFEKLASGKAQNVNEKNYQVNQNNTFDENNIPKYQGKPFVIVNNNKPNFSKDDETTTSFEHYSNLDSLRRCGVAFANIGRDIMPTEKRKRISMVKPTGWHSVRYNNVKGKSLYNRCHLIGFQLAGENANRKNLITGTRYLNNEGMLPFENMVADYVKETGNHILYRVTPIFIRNELVARGVNIEAKSVEDNGRGILFNVFVFNVQPNIVIDYMTGESYRE